MTATLAAQSAEPVLGNVLITAHAVCATVAFLLGAVLAIRRGIFPAQAWAYVITLVLMTLFVAGAVIVDWPTLDPGIQGLFAALIALAAYTAWRGWRARAKLATVSPARPVSPNRPGDTNSVLASAIEDLGFSLISLFTAFVAVLANDLGAPIWLTVALGVLAVATGRLLVARIKTRRLQSQQNAQPRPRPAARPGSPRTPRTGSSPRCR